MIKSARKQEGGFLVTRDDATVASVPDDLGNRDRQDLQRWLDEGNHLEEDSAQKLPAYNWQGLAIAFTLSELNQLLNKLKDESSTPQVNTIWRISDELVRTITLAIFSENDRVAGMVRYIGALLEILEQDKINVPQSAVLQIIQALRDNGFGSAADEIASRSSVV